MSVYTATEWGQYPHFTTVLTQSCLSLYSSSLAPSPPPWVSSQWSPTCCLAVSRPLSSCSQNPRVSNLPCQGPSAAPPSLWE